MDLTDRGNARLFEKFIARIFYAEVPFFHRVKSIFFIFPLFLIKGELSPTL